MILTSFFVNLRSVFCQFVVLKHQVDMNKDLCFKIPPSFVSPSIAFGIVIALRIVIAFSIVKAFCVARHQLA